MKKRKFNFKTKNKLNLNLSFLALSLLLISIISMTYCWIEGSSSINVTNGTNNVTVGNPYSAVNIDASYPLNSINLTNYIDNSDKLFLAPARLNSGALQIKNGSVYRAATTNDIGNNYIEFDVKFNLETEHEFYFTDGSAITVNGSTDNSIKVALKLDTNPISDVFNASLNNTSGKRTAFVATGGSHTLKVIIWNDCNTAGYDALAGKTVNFDFELAAKSHTTTLTFVDRTANKSAENLASGKTMKVAAQVNGQTKYFTMTAGNDNSYSASKIPISSLPTAEFQCYNGSTLVAKWNGSGASENGTYTAYGSVFSSTLNGTGTWKDVVKIKLKDLSYSKTFNGATIYSETLYTSYGVDKYEMYAKDNVYTAYIPKESFGSSEVIYFNAANGDDAYFTIADTSQVNDIASQTEITYSVFGKTSTVGEKGDYQFVGDWYSGTVDTIVFRDKTTDNSVINNAPNLKVSFAETAGVGNLYFADFNSADKKWYMNVPTDEMGLTFKAYANATDAESQYSWDGSSRTKTNEQYIYTAYTDGTAITGTWNYTGSEVDPCPQSILNGTKVSFYAGNNWGGTTMYIASENTNSAYDQMQSATNTITYDSKTYNYGSFAEVDSKNYYIKQNLSWAGKQIGENAQGGAFYGLYSSNSVNYIAKNSATTAKTTPSATEVELNSTGLTVSTTDFSSITSAVGTDLYVQHFIKGPKDSEYKLLFTSDKIAAKTDVIQTNVPDEYAQTVGTLTVKTVLTDGTVYYVADTDSVVVKDSTVTTKRTVYFDNTNSNWSKVYAYAWQDSNSSNKNSAWPGVEMTKVSGNIYSITLDDDNWDKIIFNPGSSSGQTGNLTIMGDGYVFTYDSSKTDKGTWSKYGGGPETDTRTIYLTGSYTGTPTIWYWYIDSNNSETKLAENDGFSWSGPTMTKVSDNVWSYKLSGDSAKANRFMFNGDNSSAIVLSDDNIANSQFLYDSSSKTWSTYSP
ncbi:MAG: starch-binding protein [Ruminococcus sp.]